MGKIEKSSGSISIIGGSDGPTSVFLAGRKKKTLKQRVHKRLFQLRKKWYSLGIKPNARTMDEVIHYIEERYGFVEISRDAKGYLLQRDGLRTSFILQYKPELLGEYAAPPKLKSRDEEGIREFLKQSEIREQKAKEISEDKFSIDFHIFEKQENGNTMQICIESRFGYIGGEFSGSGKDGKSPFKKIYKDVYRYYGVTKEDIANGTKRYQELLTTLAIRG